MNNKVRTVRGADTFIQIFLYLKKMNEIAKYNADKLIIYVIHRAERIFKNKEVFLSVLFIEVPKIHAIIKLNGRKNKLFNGFFAR